MGPLPLFHSPAPRGSGGSRAAGSHSRMRRQVQHLRGLATRKAAASLCEGLPAALGLLPLRICVLDINSEKEIIQFGGFFIFFLPSSTGDVGSPGHLPEPCRGRAAGLRTAPQTPSGRPPPPVSALRPGRPRSRTRGSPRRLPPPSANGGRAGTGAAGASHADWLLPAPPLPVAALSQGIP